MKHLFLSLRFKLSRDNTYKLREGEEKMVGCLLLHSFRGTPRQVEPLANFLSGHGWKMSAPTLPGHGVEKDDMKRVNSLTQVI